MISYVVIGISSLVVIGLVLMLLSRERRKAGRPTKKHDSSALALSLSDEKMKSDIILNAIADGVMLIDSAENIQSFNPAAAIITGWPEKEAVGISFRSVIQLANDKGAPYTQEQDPIAKAMKTKQTVRDRKANLLTRSQKLVSLDITVSPLVDDESNLRGAVAIFRDVSEQREEEAQRADFISTASHEMRTPVAAIEGYLALALNDRVSNIDEKARSYLKKAHESTQHLGVLFQDLLTSSKAEDGRLVNNPEVVEMSAFLSKLVEDFRFTTQAKNLNLEFILGAPDSVVTAGNSVVKPLYYCHVDPDRIREVITNLFDNAIKYTERGKITIGLTGDDSVVQIRVSDTGSGIASEDVPHLFQKFYRVDSSITREVGGTGLGLFICRKIVELYNGRIWVESELNQGSTFFINLPRLSNDKAESMQAQNPATPVIKPAGQEVQQPENHVTIPSIST